MSRDEEKKKDQEKTGEKRWANKSGPRWKRQKEPGGLLTPLVLEKDPGREESSKGHKYQPRAGQRVGCPFGPPIPS